MHRVLTRYGLARLAHLDRPTGRADPPLRTRPARRAGPRRHQEARPDPRRRRPQGPRPRRPAARPASGVGYGYIHTAVDDHSRLAYSEILRRREERDRRRVLAPGPRVLRRHGITVERVLTDNGSCYKLTPLARHPRRAGHHPQAHPALPAPDQRQGRTLQPHPARRMGLRPALHLRSRTTRRLARSWLHTYNHHRCHTALGGQPPASRVTNLQGNTASRLPRRPLPPAVRCRDATAASPRTDLARRCARSRRRPRRRASTRTSAPPRPALASST